MKMKVVNINRTSIDLAEIAIKNLKEAVEKCNTGSILHAAAVARHLEDGFYFDKSINSDKFRELDLIHANLMNKFIKNCSCSRS